MEMKNIIKLLVMIYKVIKKKLLNQGYIEVDRKGKYQVNARINGTQQRVIKVKNIYFNDD